MKKIKMLFVVSMMLLTTAAFSQNKDKVVMKVNGLGCPYCSIGFVKKIKGLGEVSDIDTDYEKGLFYFSINPKSNLTLDKLKATTKKAGYTLVYANIDYTNKQDVKYGELK